MCGIYGMVSLRDRPLRHPSVIEEMARSLRHRGPDGHAIFRKPRVIMGVERLRIVDLHERADQPFASPDDGCWIATNGEIYNARELRRRYSNYPFRSGSDVEAILPLYLDRGADGLPELDGMFGLALWDERRRSLLLARDRAGEKPLFYARIAGEVWFASEIQALLLHPDLNRDLDEIALSQFLTLGYVLEPRTLFREVRRIEAGTLVEIQPHQETVVRYWDLDALGAAPPPSDPSPEHLQALLEEAVSKQLTADVPLGVFVSGGLDSSLLAILAARERGPDQVRTFAIRFAAESYDESSGAREVARQLGTRHYEVTADEETLGEALREVTGKLAEPVADPAILPTFLLARKAREHVTAVLSGEGADELFGGYPTYLGHKVAPWYQQLPAFVRRGCHRAIDHLPTSDRKVTVEFLLKRFLNEAEKPWAERHLSWFGTGLDTHCKELRAVWMKPLLERLAGGDPLAGAMILDYQTYLRDNLLVKVDRATMLNSLEARAPYLDRDLSAFALALPTDLRVRRLTTKWLLKKVARKWLGRGVVVQRKRGLSVPVAGWLNDGLRGETDRLLDRRRLEAQGLVDAEQVGRLLEEHRQGRANHARPLWTALMLQYWLDRWVPERASG